EAEVVPWMLQALDAVAYIHSQDIIHRDIKPSNMKLTPSHQIVLVDFGIAKVGSHAHTGLVAHGCFTPYMAPPEQCTMNGKTGVYTDIYGLGATMYNLLTGRYPPDAVSRMMGEDLTNPRLFNPALSLNTEQVILKAMEILPQNRFQSAMEMKEALRRSPGAQVAQVHLPIRQPISPQQSPAGPQTPDPQAAAGGIFRREIRR
ncbi:MAG: serine/threonine protein kinase, partial [Armatimonadetes bacterium]|nr:serine/threonine protein kinase [Armatimonadota bacterium]